MPKAGCGAPQTGVAFLPQLDGCYTGRWGELAPEEENNVPSVLPGWSPDLERSFKELLYRFLEEVHSTKAALYLLSGDGRFLLVTQYGFGRRDLLAAEFPARAPMVQLARHLRNRVKSYNDPDAAGEVAEYLEGAGTARLLLVPLYAGSRLLGLVDARDKGRKKPFTGADEEAAATIGKALVGLLRETGLYSDLEESGPEPVEGIVQEEPVAPKIRETSGLGPRAMETLLETMETLAGLDGVGGVALTLAGENRVHTAVRAGASLREDEVAALRSHHRGMLGDRLAGLTLRDWVVEAGGVTGDRGSPREIAASAIVLEEDGWALCASVLASLGSVSAPRVLNLLRAQAKLLSRAETGTRRWRRLARLLLEPGEARYPELVAHSEAVSRIAWRLSIAMGEDDETVEAAAVAGLLHDVGLRELDYETLYKHPNPGPMERRVYTRHPLLGEQILNRAGLSMVAHAVRHHHERWDGGGYPDRLQAGAIPLLSRIVHVAEVYDVLTSDTSYRRPVGRGEALGILRSAAGHQFDPDIVLALEGVV